MIVVSNLSLSRQAGIRRNQIRHLAGSIWKSSGEEFLGSIALATSRSWTWHQIQRVAMGQMAHLASMDISIEHKLLWRKSKQLRLTLARCAFSYNPLLFFGKHFFGRQEIALPLGTG